jgi:hypothetical protein
MRALTIVCVIAALPSAAAAQGSDRTAAEAVAISYSDTGSYRSKANDWMIMPEDTTTLGGGLQFVMAPEGFGPGAVRFTDVVMLSLQLRTVLGKRYELYGGASFLPKQPSFSDELAWQHASGGLRVGVGKRYASHLAVAGGPLLDDRGDWAAGAIGVQSRKSLHETLVIEGAAGMAYTTLFENARDRPSRLVEATASAELVFRAPKAAAGWIGTEFRFPVHDSSTASDAGDAPYDPQTRVNVHLGVVLSYIDDWDVYAKLLVVDRGDVLDPATTLPILDGGFDQKQLVIGLTHHFDGDRREGRDDY